MDKKKIVGKKNRLMQYGVLIVAIALLISGYAISDITFNGNDNTITIGDTVISDDVITTQYIDASGDNEGITFRDASNNTIFEIGELDSGTGILRLYDNDHLGSTHGVCTGFLIGYDDGYGFNATGALTDVSHDNNHISLASMFGGVLISALGSSDISDVNISSTGDGDVVLYSADDVLIHADDGIVFEYGDAFVDFKSTNGAAMSGIRIWDDAANENCLSFLSFGYDSAGTFVSTGGIGDGSSTNYNLYMSSSFGNVTISAKNDVGEGTVEISNILLLHNCTAAPTYPKDGMIAYADGTSWNPGDGQGVYCYYNVTWHRMG